VAIGTDTNKELLFVEAPLTDAPNVTTKKMRLMEAQRMIEEIDVTVLLQQELMKSDPLLASASFFLSAVCGGERKSRNDKNISDENVKMAGTALRVPPTIDRPQSSARCVQKQRVIRITASELLLKGELAKENPLVASIAAFRKAAYGDESRGNTNQYRGQIATIKTSLGAVIDLDTEHTRTSTSQTSASVLSGVSA